MQESFIRLNPAQFNLLLVAQLDPSLLYLFECYLRGIDPLATTESSKAKAWKETLVRKGYITAEGKVTSQGEQFYQALVDTKPIKEVLLEIKKKAESDFDRWWAIFPGNNTFTVNGREFAGSRSLRTNKDKCREKFAEIVNSGEYTAEEIIQATEMDIVTRKLASLKSNSNELKYLQNSMTYLNQKTFDGYVDQVRQGKTPPQLTESTVGGRRTFTLK